MSEIRGIGVDLCGVARMQPLLSNDRFLTRYFTADETAYVRSKGASGAATLAGLYAAKEAVCKALGTGIAFPLRDIEITHTPQGQPRVALRGEGAAVAGGGDFHLSISHEGDTAVAFVVWTA